MDTVSEEYVNHIVCVLFYVNIFDQTQLAWSAHFLAIN